MPARADSSCALPFAPAVHLEMDELDEAEQELVRRELQENANQSAVARAAGDK